MKDHLSDIFAESLDAMDSCDVVAEAAESVSFSPLDSMMETASSTEVMDELFPSELHKEFSSLL